MSMVLLGKDLPQTCAGCPCCYDSKFEDQRYFCCADDAASDIPDITAGRLPSCPARALPKTHGRLIDADRLIAVFESTTSITQSDYNLWNHIIGLIQHAPTVLAAEGVNTNND